MVREHVNENGYKIFYEVEGDTITVLRIVPANNEPAIIVNCPAFLGQVE